MLRRQYKGSGLFEYNRKELPVVKHVGMVAGGTGITPMLQVRQHTSAYLSIPQHTYAKELPVAKHVGMVAAPVSRLCCRIC